MKSTRRKKKARKKGSKKSPKSPKGALIKGMSKQLPSDILDNPLFTRRLKEIMRGYAGIYALYRRKKLYYVGLTTNLLGRIRVHQKRDRHAGKWDHFTIFRIQRVRYLKDMETLIHQLVTIPGISAKGKVPRDADLNRVLREVLQEEERKMREIKAALSRRK